MSESNKFTSNPEDILDILPEKGYKIPKIIHYCWFGGKPIPENLQKYMDSWNNLEGYSIMRWDESNCGFDENDFIKKAYQSKQFCYVSDYYRLKVLYEYGGVYLDTDVRIFKSLDKLLKHPMFLNFIYDSVVGCGIVGSFKHNPLIKSLLDMYDKTVFVSGDSTNAMRGSFHWDGNKFLVKGFVTNNYYVTYYFLRNYPDFKLNNKYQDLKDFVIYPKEYFEIGSLLGKQYAIHYAEGAWRTKIDNSHSLKSRIKQLIQKNEKVFETLQKITRKVRYYRQNKKLPFYNYSVAQKKGKKLPEIE